MKEIYSLCGINAGNNIIFINMKIKNKVSSYSRRLASSVSRTLRIVRLLSTYLTYPTTFSKVHELTGPPFSRQVFSNGSSRCISLFSTMLSLIILRQIAVWLADCK